jgi:DNA-binding phage protein
MEPRTGAERYFRDRQSDPKYATAYRDARQRITEVDQLMRTFDQQRVVLDLTKAELARRTGMRPEAVRRLFSARHANPTLSTVVALAHELGLDLVAVPTEERRARAASALREPVKVTAAPSDVRGTRRRSA